MAAPPDPTSSLHRFPWPRGEILLDLEAGWLMVTFRSPKVLTFLKTPPPERFDLNEVHGVRRMVGNNDGVTVYSLRIDAPVAGRRGSYAMEPEDLDELLRVLHLWFGEELTAASRQRKQSQEAGERSAAHLEELERRFEAGELSRAEYDDARRRFLFGDER
jgi:hypothetical protein